MTSTEKAAPAASADARGLRVGIVAASFNAPLVDRLVERALATLEELGLPRERVALWRAPGAFELPLLASALIRADRPDAVVALGAVVRGETAHFDFVAGEAARGLAAVARETGVPVGFGVLATETWEQAEARTRPPLDRGSEAARAAVQMARTLERLRRAGTAR